MENIDTIQVLRGINAALAFSTLPVFLMVIRNLLIDRKYAPKKIRGTNTVLLVFFILFCGATIYSALMSTGLFVGGLSGEPYLYSSRFLLNLRDLLINSTLLGVSWSSYIFSRTEK